MEIRFILGAACACMFLAVDMGSSMANTEKLGLKIVGGPVREPGMLRLMHGPKGPVALVSQTVTVALGAETDFRALELSHGGDWRSLTKIQALVPAMPAWDAAPQNGHVDIVYELAGGALNALILLAPPAAPVSITAAYPANNFAKPRFAKMHAGSPRWVTAILESKTCVALPVPRSGKYHVLADCADGLLLADGPGYTFLYKVDLPGAARGIATLPGSLHLQSLDAQLQPVGKPVDVSKEKIFEFDAEIRDHTLILLATTSTGCFVAVRNNGSAGVTFRVNDYAAPPTLVSPALMALSPAKSIIAALDSGKLVVAEHANP